MELKEEAEIHPEFGIQAEENLRQQMSQAALVNTKMNRTRHKINDAKGIDAPKSVLSATQSAKESPSPSSKAIQSTPQSEPKSKLVLNESQSVVSSASNSPQKKDDLEFVSSFLGKKLDFSTAKAPSVESSSSTSKNNNYQNIVNSSHSMPKTIISPPDRNLDSKKMVNPSKKLIESSDSDHSGDENNDESSSDSGDESSEDEKRHKGVKKKYHAQINPKQPSPLISKGNSNAALNEPPMLVRNDSSIEEIIKLSRPDSKGQSPDYDDSANAGQFSTKQLLDESRQEKSAKQKMDELLSMPSHRDQLTEEEEAVRSDEIEQIKVLREHAKTLEKLDDLLAAEVLHERALELDPTDIRTLQGYAMFLHQKKGELARAEAFFNRALQLSFPSLYTQLHTPHLRKSLLDASSPAALDKTLSAFSPPSKTSLSEISFRDDKIKIKHVVNLLMTFSNFMSKSKGDIEAAAILLQKASALAEDDAFPQATYAHFCSIHTDVCKDVAERDVDTLFRKAMKLDPKNPVYKMWYAKFLKRLGKLGPAELMYQAALETSRGHPKNEATAICNYATFLFKQRKSTDKAGNLFEIGLSTFPEHRGLRKNFAQLQKKLLKLEAKNNQDIPTKALDVISTAPQLAAESKPVAPNLKIDTGVNEFTLSTSPARRSENSSPMKKRDITSSQSRGSRRAQRMQQSLVTQIPTELDNSESRSNFILTQLGVADRLVSSSEGLKDKNALIKEVDVEDDDEDEIIGNNKFLEKLRGTPLLPKKKQDPSSILSPKAEKQDLSAWTETEGKSLFFRDGSSSNLLTEDETGVVPLSAIAADLNELGARPSTSFRQSHPEYKYYEDDENDEDEDENDIDDYM